METIVQYVIEQFGIIGAIIICVIFFGWYFIFRQPKLINNMGDNISSKMIDAIRSDNKTTANILLQSVKNQHEDNQKLMDILVNQPSMLKADHDKKLDEVTNIDSQVLELISGLQKSTHCDRVAVLQFHNGSTNLDGVPFKEYDMKYEWQAKGVAVLQGKCKDMPSSTLFPVIKDVEDSKTVIYNEKILNELYDRSAPLYHYLKEELNCKTVVFNALYGVITNKLIGFLCIEYQDTTEMFDKYYLQDDVDDVRPKVASFLSLKEKNN